MNAQPERDNVGLGEIHMTLFVTGMTSKSSRAILNIKALCESERRCKLKIIDIYVDPAMAVQEQVYAVPMLVKYKPWPERRVIGDMSDMEQVRRSLGLLAA